MPERSPATAALGAKLAQEIIKRLVAAVRQDRANRYSLIKPWVLPKLTEYLPDYDGPLIYIRDSIITVLPYKGDVNDGCTLAPDRVGPWRTVIGACFHDPWYLELEAISAAWGWKVSRVRLLGDQIFFGILAIIAPTWLARTYFYTVRAIGGVAHTILRLTTCLVIISIMSSGCSGCANPESPFEDPGTFTLPDYEQTAGGQP